MNLYIIIKTLFINMIKSVLCKFYNDGSCRYISNPSLCPFAHSENELVIPDCKFGEDCRISRCSFNHYIKKPIENTEVNIKDLIKINNKKVKNKITKNKLKNFILNDIKNEEKIVKNKSLTFNNTLFENKNFHTPSIMNYDITNNKLLLYIDNYYINIINKLKNKIKFFKKQVSQYNNRILLINEEFNMLKEKNKKLVKKINYVPDRFNVSTNTDGISNIDISVKTNINKIYNGIDTYTQIDNQEYTNSITKGIFKGIEDNNRKCKKIERYNKWINIYDIFKKYKFNYKIIKDNIKEINFYVKDNNIYKIKERCTKVYKYYCKLLNKEVNEYLSVTEIFSINI